jgi:hypothetical protein
MLQWSEIFISNSFNEKGLSTTSYSHIFGRVYGSVGETNYPQ